MTLLFATWSADAATLAVVLFTSVYLYFTFRYRYWKNRGVPHQAPTFPFGNIADMVLLRKSFGDQFKEIYEQTEGHNMVGIYQLCSPGVVVRHPDMVKLVLVKDFAHFHDHGFYFNEKVDPLSEHLFLMEGVKWKHLRYKLTPTFTSGKMKMMYPTLVACGKQLQEHLADKARRNESLEMKDVLAKYSTDVIATCAFGIQSNSLANPDSEFRKNGRKLFDTSFVKGFKILVSVLFPKLARLFKISNTEKDVSDFFIGVVQETIDYREKNNISRNDFMELLIKIKNKKSISDNTDEVETNKMSDNYYDVNGMTVNEVAAQAFVFFIAGFETTSTTMSFCLHELAVNPEVQERLQQEVDSVLRDHGGELTYEAILEMTYLDNVVAETLRKYPPVPAILRVCTKPYKVPGYKVTIEKGTTIIVPVLGLHNDPKYYPEPEVFNPDRFSEEEKSKRHHFVYLPFGEGPRICIGSRFGLMQTKVGLASLVARYQFNVCKKTTVIPLVIDPKSFILSVVGGVNLQITDRT